MAIMILVVGAVLFLWLFIGLWRMNTNALAPIDELTALMEAAVTRGEAAAATGRRAAETKRRGSGAKGCRGGDSPSVDNARKLDSNDARKVNTRRLECDHFGGLGVDQAVGGGGCAARSDC
jgi:hypothetical protein